MPIKLRLYCGTMSTLNIHLRLDFDLLAELAELAVQAELIVVVVLLLFVVIAVVV